MRSILCAGLAALAVSACSGSDAEPSPTATPTEQPKVYVMTTGEGMAWLRRVVAAYDQGDLDIAKSQCSEGRLQLSLNDLENVGTSNDRGARLDYQTLEEICAIAESEGWAAVSDAAHLAVK